jgi:hypothetical protein
MDRLLNKDTGHSFVVLTEEDFQKALEMVYSRAKEAAVAGINMQIPRKEDTLLSKNEAMTILGKSANTLWKWERRGYLVPLRVGGRVMYKEHDLRRILGKKGGHYGQGK